MRVLNRIPAYAAACAALFLPSISQAGTPTPSIPVDIVVRPADAVAAAATAVPTLSQNLLIALGLLLAVIALRTLQRQQGAKKLLGLVILGSGMAIGGAGIERTIASGTSIPNGDICTAGGKVPYFAQFENQIFSNFCPNDMVITNYEMAPNQFCSDLDVSSSGCPVGTVLAATSGSCTPLPICEDD
jgi:exosortase sorting signal-containing protein